MNNISEHQIERLYDISANTGVVVEQTINGLIRVFVTPSFPDAEKQTIDDKISLLYDLGINATIIAAAIQATTSQMIANVDILNTKPSHLDMMRIYMKKYQQEQ
jgi:hypothetical protein